MRSQLQAMKVPELKARALEYGIDGADSMNKAELVDAIEEAEALAAAGGAADAADREPPRLKKNHANKSFQNHPKFDKFKKGNDQ